MIYHAEQRELVRDWIALAIGDIDKADPLWPHSVKKAISTSPPDMSVMHVDCVGVYALLSVLYCAYWLQLFE